MNEESLYSVQCVLMVYNDSSKQWITCGNHTHSRVYILHNAVTESYRFVGVSEQDREVILNSDVYKGLKYNQATPVFHQWRDYSRQVYGIKFNSQEDAEGFAAVVRTVLDSLQKSQQSSDVSSAGNYSVATLSRVPLPSDKTFYFSQPSQPAENHATMYATPSSSMQSRASNAEQAYSQTKPVTTPLAVSQSGPRTPGLIRQPSQPSYEQNGQAASESSVPDQTRWTNRRSASSGNVLDNMPGVSQHLTQAADPGLFRVPSESAVQHHEATPMSTVPTPPPLPAVNMGGLAEALKSATGTLRKTAKVGDEQPNAKAAGGTMGRSTSITGTTVTNQSEDMMSDLARRLQERRAKTDQMPSDFDAMLPAKNLVSDVTEVVPSTPFKAPVPPPPPVAGRDTPAKSDKRGQTVMGQSQPSVPVVGQSQPSVPVMGQSQPSGQLPVNVATTADLEHLKRELTTFMRSEIAAAKYDIVEAISKMMNR